MRYLPVAIAFIITVALGFSLMGDQSQQYSMGLRPQFKTGDRLKLRRRASPTTGYKMYSRVWIVKSVDEQHSTIDIYDEQSDTHSIIKNSFEDAWELFEKAN